MIPCKNSFPQLLFCAKFDLTPHVHTPSLRSLVIDGNFVIPTNSTSLLHIVLYSIHATTETL